MSSQPSTAPTPPAGEVLPRSFLYVPAVRPDLFTKAADGPADAVVLDLEDAVPLPDKERARADVRAWLADRAPFVPGPERSPDAGAEPWVRVNAEYVVDDLEAVVHPALAGIFLAKCAPDVLDEAARALERLEPARGLARGAVRVVGLVESAAALVALDAMARHPRLSTFGIGEVDLLGDLRIARTERSAGAVEHLRTQVVVHCAAHGLAAPVAPTSTDFRDLDAFRETTREMRDLGFRSRTAIHPRQLAVVHEVLTPDEADLAAARDVMARFSASGGGVTTDDAGRLIDAAVVREARETLSRSR